MNKAKKFEKIINKYGNYNEVTEEDGKIKVGGSLYLSNTNITELPDNLTVGGS